MNDEPCDPPLDPDDLREFRKGVEEFNAGKFFECHESLEEVWLGIRGPARGFFQGIIQVAVGFYHLGNGNLTGAQSQLEKGLSNLAPYGDCFAGLDVSNLRSEVQSWLEKIRREEDLRCAVADLPKLHLTP